MLQRVLINISVLYHSAGPLRATLASC